MKTVLRTEKLYERIAEALENAGGGGGSLPDLDTLDFGNDPSLPEDGKTDPQNYEDIAEAINTALARPNAVTLESLSVTQNGTTTAPSGTAYNSVSVNVQKESFVADSGGFFDPSVYPHLSGMNWKNTDISAVVRVLNANNVAVEVSVLLHPGFTVDEGGGEFAIVYAGIAYVEANGGDLEDILLVTVSVYVESEEDIYLYGPDCSYMGGYTPEMSVGRAIIGSAASKTSDRLIVSIRV